MLSKILKWQWWTRRKKCIKIHFVGYGNEYVGWRDLDIDSDQLLFVRLKKNYVPDVESFEDRKQMFHDNLYKAIKRKLWSGRIIRIELQLDSGQNVFDTGLDDIYT